MCLQHFGVWWLCLEVGRRALSSENFKVDLLDEFFLQKDLLNPKSEGLPEEKLERVAFEGVGGSEQLNGSEQG